MVEDRDAFFMRKALGLAERGRGRTTPNPMVGALVVDAEGVIVGRGAHEFAGGPHAEVHALADAGDKANGATLYCTLEPCSHQGRTPPCAPRVAAAGIVRVVTATEDPNPQVAGKGHDLLRGAQIDVSSGVMANEARALNAPFFNVMRRGRPYVTVKIATSLDGRIAGARREAVRLTGTPANRDVHRYRAEVDALAIGSGTLLADDPLLTPREAWRARPLTRVIFDRRLRTSPGARIFSTLDQGPVIIVSTDQSRERGRVRVLEAAGAIVHTASEPGSLQPTLRWLAAFGVQSLIVEGGTTLHRAFWDEGLVDRVQLYLASAVLGGDAIPWLPFPVVTDSRVQRRLTRPLGDDVLIEAYVHGTD